MTLQEKQVDPEEGVLHDFPGSLSISEMVEDLKAQGYQLEFRREADCLYCIDLSCRIAPGNFVIEKYYHFEDISHTDRDRMLYAITAEQGLRGYLLDASFVYQDNISPEMARKLQVEYPHPGNTKNYPSPVDAVIDLQRRGYDADFEPQSDCLYCSDLDLRLYEEEFHVDEVYHFEGDDKFVVYALTSPTGVKGTVMDRVGMSSEEIAFDMTKERQNDPAVAGR